MFLFNLQTKNQTIRFERDITDNLINVDKIHFIKAIRDTTHCGLLEAKNFADLMIKELNKMSTSPDLARMQIRSELDEITTSNDLLDILRFVRTVKDHPKPILGTFTDDGEYRPF